MQINILSLILLIAGTLFFTPSPAGEKTENTGKAQENRNKGKEHARVLEMLQCGINCQIDENNPDEADSLLRLAIDLAEMTYDKELILLSYNAYLECMDQRNYARKRNELIARVESLALQLRNDTLLWRTYVNLSAVYRDSYAHDRALECSYQSLTYAEASNSDARKVRSLISIGKCLEGKNQFLEAFRSYLQALTIAEPANDPVLLREVYKALTRFYLLSKDHEKAIEYKLKEADIIQSVLPVDSMALMWTILDLEEINQNSTRRVNEHNIMKLLDFADRQDKQRLRFVTVSLFRAYLINSEQAGKLRELYMQKYPDELQDLASTDTSMYYRVRALICEYEGKADSAAFYFRQAERSLDGEPNKIRKSNFYIRYGQFLNRHRQPAEALGMFQNAYRLASESNYLDYATQACQELEKAYVNMGDYQNAYKYAHLTMVLSDSMDNISKRDDLLRMEIENASLIRNEAIERETAARQRQYNLQYMAITIIMVLAFVILMMLASFRVPRWSVHLLGFISFILLFEFIILILDQKIHAFTHGEPWKVLLIKVFLIGIMMPLHHYSERKVIRYVLTTRGVRLNWSAFRHFLRELYNPEEHHPGPQQKA